MTASGGRSLPSMALVALVLACVACGGEEPAQPPVPERGARIGAVEKAPSPQEIEEFAEVQLPVDTSGLEAWARSSVDTSLSFRLAMSRRDFDLFYERASFTEELTKGMRPSISEEGSLDWRLEAIESPWGHEELVNGFSRSILVDFENPGRPVVYMTASTT